jgi:carbon storage regulator CsrA
LFGTQFAKRLAVQCDSHEHKSTGCFKEIAMLVLTRKANQQLLIGNDIVITVVKVRGNTIRLGIEAPRDVRVVRSELDAKPETKTAADASPEASVLISGAIVADAVLELNSDRTDTVDSAPVDAKLTAKRTTLKAFANSKFKRAPQATRDVEDSPLCHAAHAPHSTLKNNSISSKTGCHSLHQRAPLNQRTALTSVAPLVNVPLSSLALVSRS